MTFMQWITQSGWKGHLIALLAGGLTPLFLAPFNIWPCAFISIGLFYLGLTTLPVKQVLLRSWCYGTGAYLAGVSWIYVSINTFGNAPVWLAACLTVAFCCAVAFFFVIPAFIWVKWFRLEQGYFLGAWVFAGVWAIQEWFRGWFLTGFPWLYAGYSQLDAPLAGYAPIGGVWFISFLIAFITVLLINSYVYKQQKYKVAIGIIIVLGLFALGPLLHTVRWTTELKRELPVTLVQGNINQAQKWDSSFYNKQFNLYWQLTTHYQRQDSLVIWPENAVPFLKETVQPVLEGTITDFEKKYNSALITGLPIRQANQKGELRYYNGITVAGRGEGTYLKQKLVPFGEYVPLEEWLRGVITFFDLPMSDFSQGPSEQALLKMDDYLIAPFICYEVVYPDFVASFGASSNLLITISNDTWFGHSIGPKQHLQMAQMRALESDRWMVRATNNGITAIIDNKGKIVKQLPSFEEGVLQGHVLLVKGKTPYQWWSSYFILFVSLSGLLWSVIIRKRQKK